MSNECILYGTDIINWSIIIISIISTLDVFPSFELRVREAEVVLVEVKQHHQDFVVNGFQLKLSS